MQTSCYETFLVYAAVGLLTAGLGVAVTTWLTYHTHVASPILTKVELNTANDKDDAVEIVFRDLIQRYPQQPLYFFSFAETDPSDAFMARFHDDPRVKKLSQAIRNANQVMDAVVERQNNGLRRVFDSDLSQCHEQ